MSLEAQIEQDLKQAMLAKDQQVVSTLRLVKSALLYVKVEKGVRDTELDDGEVQALLSKEAKKRQESADLYEKGGNPDSAQAELAEKAIIEKYLPQQIGEDELRQLVTETASQLGITEPTKMGQLIGAVKGKVGAAGDGAVIAKLAKELLAK
ncbi:GatB/YqeY domain-containing protein [Candidatus Saccharibacteria bacterium]|nr:GatB/YqeY domain-containing protein [Candidatus Saccharibacteria bacterium]